MNEIDVKIHKIGIVTCALSGKEGDGLVVSFGEFKVAPLSWKSFRQLVAMRCPKTESRPATPAPPPQPIPNGPVATPK